MKDTVYKIKQGERQAQLIKDVSWVFEGAKNMGLASWKDKDGNIAEGMSRKVLVSEDRRKNLYAPIREGVINYVKNASISWWHMCGENHDDVTAHTLSSQVSCFNHLFLIRNDEVAIKTILKVATGISFDEILPSFIENDTLISFEFVFENKALLKEQYETRGTHCTSIDALIYARKGAEKWLIPIEWKYTESYDVNAGYQPNYKRYEELVSKNSCLLSWQVLFYKDPFYELARQTLLMEKIIEKHPEIADRFFHIIVVPKENVEMNGDASKFCSSLKQDSVNSHRIVSPVEFLETLEGAYPDLIRYLCARYW